MLDIKFIRENPQLIKKAAKDKNFANVEIDRILALDAEIGPVRQKLEECQAQRNRISKEIPKASPAEQSDLKETVKNLKGQIDALSTEVDSKSAILRELMLQVPQPARADVPIGKDDSENVEIKTWGSPKPFSFKPLDHVALGEKLGIVDISRGVKIAGSRSYLLKGDGARLEAAVMRYAYDKLVGRGYTPISVPVLVEEQVMEGTGYFPIGRDQAYFVEKDKLALVGTAEVSLCGMHGDDVFEHQNLPARYFAHSSCFRREAGTYGKDTKGFYRVHQFQKIEMVIFSEATEAASDALHAELLENAESLLQDLRLPYRVVYVCTGDLGQGQVRKHDIETWMPSRAKYGETHSCSSFYDFQARRLNIRYKDKEGGRKFAYTLNNTACASPRILIPIIENYQLQDGRIEIPECLRPYMGGKTHIG